MNDYKIFIGPMSKNVVDATIDFCNDTNNNVGLIPSRRQIEFDGGYSNNWKTKTFCEYVNNLTNKIILQRDHAGPEQGKNIDDGYESLIEDCKYFNIIHIDPWKKHSTYEEGLLSTISMINFCSSKNSNLLYEVGTEESIRPFTYLELDKFLKDLKSKLSKEVFDRIIYVVIQSGTSLNRNNQTGNYDSNRLKDMITVCKRYNKLSKEHNGDYIPFNVIKEKFNFGLDSINIAPEFGLIETNTYLSIIDDDLIFDKYWKMCYDSKKWVKWVDEKFDPFNNKKELIKICGHYILSSDDFIEQIKSNITKDIDSIVKSNIKNKLNELCLI